MRAPTSRGAALCAAIVTLLSAGAALAADEAAVLVARASRLAAAGQCDAALPILREARSLDPEAADAALLEGQCLLDAKQYADAVAPLTDAARLDPDSGQAALALGMAQYHSGDLEGASIALERAERQLPDSAEAALYLGLVMLGDDPDSAAGRFENAALWNGSLAPAATYYAGVARAGAGQREEAEVLLRRVTELAPGSAWAAQAQAALDAPLSSYVLRRWAVFYAGLDYDSNVVLRADGIALPAGISNQGDGLGWWGVEAGHEVFRTENWGGGVLGSYYGNAHFSENDFDQHLLGAAFWIDRSLGAKTLLRIQPEFGQAWYGNEDYLRFYGVLGEVLHDWGRAGLGTFYARYTYNDYQYPIPGAPALQSTRNRDGNMIRGGYDHVYAIDDQTAVRGGPFFDYYAAKGSEWDHYGGGLWAGIERQLPCEFVVDLMGSVAYEGYKHPSTYLMPGEKVQDRQDVISMVQLAVSRPIFRRVLLTARYRYQYNYSNTDVFDYDRNIVGAYLTVPFGD